MSVRYFKSTIHNKGKEFCKLYKCDENSKWWTLWTPSATIFSKRLFYNLNPHASKIWVQDSVKYDNSWQELSAEDVMVELL